MKNTNPYFVCHAQPVLPPGKIIDQNNYPALAAYFSEDWSLRRWDPASDQEDWTGLQRLLMKAFEECGNLGRCFDDLARSSPWHGLGKSLAAAAMKLRDIPPHLTVHRRAAALRAIRRTSVPEKWNDSLEEDYQWLRASPRALRSEWRALQALRHSLKNTDAPAAAILPPTAPDTSDLQRLKVARELLRTHPSPELLKEIRRLEQRLWRAGVRLRAPAQPWGPEDDEALLEARRQFRAAPSAEAYRAVTRLQVRRYRSKTRSLTSSPENQS